MRFPELSLALAHQGAQVITYPSAFTQTTGMAHWEVVDPWGAIIAQCSEGVGICLAEIDLDYVAKVRSEMPVWQHRRTDLYGRYSYSSVIPPDDQPVYQFGHMTVRSSQVFYRTPLSMAFVNIKPVLPGHVLVSPIRPAASLSDLSPAEVSDLFTTAQYVASVVKRHFDVPSSTVAVQDGKGAGQTVQHVHVHIVPRKHGDLENNDDIYDELQNHDKWWKDDKKVRSHDEMAAEAQQLRILSYPELAGH
ncbi:Nitrilase and fragile histidine triad fusion protein NitFhit [Bulinus truncatus]|nr:Nitrilase and fragile histidine triad fusion protein NitFhit [Bulinus truncatus]